MKVLSQTSTESAAERHFSAIDVIQPKRRASLSARSLQKRSFARAEIHNEIAQRAADFDALKLSTDAHLERHVESGQSDAAFADVIEPSNPGSDDDE